MDIVPMEFRAWIESAGAEKLLITDNVNNGNSLIRRLNRQGVTVSGLTVTTLARLAKELIIRDLAAKGEIRQIRKASDDVGAFILEGILRENPKHYSFVPQESLCTATAAEILSNLNVIRGNLLKEAYNSAPDTKLCELKQLIADYEARMSGLGLYDTCMLLEAAMEILAADNSLKVKIPTGILFTDKISVLEEAFLRTYAPGAEAVSLPAECCSTPSWHFYKSYGVWNEAEYILEDIRSRKIPFGQVCIVYTSQDYEPALLAAFGERRVPIRFLSGRPVSGMDSVRMLLSLVQWAEDGYRYEDLKSVVLNPLFVIPAEDDEKPVNGVKEFLKGIDDKIGWGLDRYKKFLYETRETEQYAESAAWQYTHPEKYLTFLQDAVSVFDGIREPVDTAALFAAMTAFVKKYSRRAEEHKYIRPLLEKKTKELAFMLPVEDIKAALALLKDRLVNMSLEDAEDSCAVSACRIGGIEILDRPYIYVIGLADRHYGSALIESPVLNDAERVRYFDMSVGNVSLAGEQAARRIENYVKSLEISEAKEIHMGYCCFDTVRQEELSPSALFLNMREKYGAEIEVLPVMEYPRVIGEDTVVRYQNVWGPDSVVEQSGGAESDSGAEQSKNTASEKADAVPDAGPDSGAEPAAEVDDGFGETDIHEMSLTFSPSSIDLMLSCPAKYNFQKNRRIPQEEYFVPDSGAWLGADDKGNFFHLVMENYISALFIGQDEIAPEMDMTAFERIFGEAARITEEQVPVESPATARQEKEEIRDVSIRYLTKLHAEFSREDCPWHVLACELGFGMKGQPAFGRDYEYIGCEESEDNEDYEEIRYHDLWHLFFRGKIDRLDGYIDAQGKQHYRIIDYKTGSYENFVKYKLDPPGGKMQTLQHHIYQMFMSEKGQVDSFSYIFPFEEREEEREIKIREFCDPMHENDDYILQVLHLLFAKGYFPAMTKIGGCAYCDYSDICISKILMPEE